MEILKPLLMRMFGRPEGALGRLGGLVMARMKGGMIASVIGLLRLRPDERVLEIGFGPGVAVVRLAEAVPAGHVAGIDPSKEMLAQAQRRNAAAMRAGTVDLRQGSVERLPFADGAFDAALAINSMQVWPDAAAGLREIHRVLRASGRLALGFTPHSGQTREGLAALLAAAGFAEPHVTDVEGGFCALARKP